MIGTAIGGIAQGIGSAAGSAISARAAKQMQKKQIEWERERAKTAHQWEVEDLKAAGLNPVLSAGGSGAVTGGVSAPMPDTSGIAEGISSAINSAMQIKQTNADTALKKSQAVLNNEQRLKTSAETILAQRNADLISAKEAWQRLENKEKQVYADNAKLSYGVKIGKDVALGVGSLVGVGGLTAAGIKNIFKNPKEANKYLQYQTSTATMPKL